MASGFPKLPGYVPTQDLEVFSFIVIFLYPSPIDYQLEES